MSKENTVTETNKIKKEITTCCDEACEKDCKKDETCCDETCEKVCDKTKACCDETKTEEPIKLSTFQKLKITVKDFFS